jgi:hypothetical protein
MLPIRVERKNYLVGKQREIGIASAWVLIDKIEKFDLLFLFIKC